ncbi:Lpg0189 family type II secretion system effector [Legionella sp. W05-934-2]|uniref:Lpg0189 family type II secretion system effector n=1 Tax=Legionella sp. W05-934-2 TaxID=1198649 RepID=UPI003462D2FB
MKKYHAISGIVLAAMVMSSQAAVKVEDAPPNSLVQRFSNEDTVFKNLNPNQSRENHPTRVIRMEGKINQSGLSCQEVQNKLGEDFLNKIQPSRFMYNTLSMCQYDPETEFATRFMMDSYFDPLTDDDEAVLEQLEQDYEGYLLYGIPLHIERAKGVVVSLEVNASREDKKGSPEVIRFRRDFNSLYFDSNYELNKQLIVDVRERFYSQDQNRILPFIQKWFYNGLERTYASMLSKVNLMELMPERIFVMNSGKPIFTSHMHMYYTNHCQKYDSKVCIG